MLPFQEVSPCLVGRHIIGTQTEQISQLLIKPFLGSADVPYFRKQLIKIVRTPIRIFQSFGINNKPLHKILRQISGGLLSELCAADSLDAITKCQNHIQGIVLDRIGFAIRGSCQNFFDNCLLGQLILF